MYMYVPPDAFWVLLCPLNLKPLDKKSILVSELDTSADDEFA